MRRMISMVLVLAAMLVYGATPASASAGGGNTSSQGDGYSVTAVSFSGDAAPAGGGRVSLGVPATCWWQPSDLTMNDSSPVDPTNADELEAWYIEAMPSMNGTFAVGRVGYGDWSKMWQPVMDKIRAGEKITAYQPKCRQSAPDCALSAFAGNAMPPIAAYTVCGFAFSLRFFATGAPPAPQIAPADLAQVAHDQMVIPEPRVDRNPKITALDAATLVGMPTWFWVTDPTSVGGTTGTRTIRAEVGPVWAQVVARTDGLHLTSPAGGVSCGADTALTAYASGVDESGACTVSFSAASVGYPVGYPVDASTAWTAAWNGSGNTGGDLAPLQRGTVVDVPVAESQTVVTDAR